MFSIVGAAYLLSALRLLLYGVRVPGVVVGLHQASGHTSAIVDFSTQNGEPVRARERMGTSFNSLRPGDEVTVAYDPRNPKRIEIVGSGSGWMGGGLFMLLGGLFAWIGAEELL